MNVGGAARGVLAGLLVAAAVAGCESAGPTPPASVRAATTPLPSAAPPPLPASAPAPAAPTVTSPPVALSLPGIGVDTSGLAPLHLLPDGVLQAPQRFEQVGWYVDGPAPGDVGPAVLAGHVDSRSGPAVFARLRDLRPGDLAVVTRADGRRVTFVVDRSQSYPKNHFPTAQVYAPTAVPELRLVTCTGSFDTGSGHYRDNLVVGAHAQG